MRNPRIPALATWSKYNRCAGARAYRYEYFIPGIGYFNITKEYANGLPIPGKEIGWQVNVTPEVEQGFCTGLEKLGSATSPAECLTFAREYVTANAHKAR